MTARNAVPNLLPDTAEMLAQQAYLSAEEVSHADLSREWCDELLDPGLWHSVLETFAGTMRLAVALTDPQGRLLGECHNPQPTWLLARGAKPFGRELSIGGSNGGCPFCLAPPAFCGAVADALRTARVVMVEDQAGLAHVAVPLSLGGRQLGALIAGQVFSRYPEPLPLQRVAREIGISQQQLWQQAIRQVPVSRAALQVDGELLMSLGQAFVGQRYAAILHRNLAQTNQRYRLFIDSVKDYALFTVDRAGRVTSWSTGAERLFGYTEAEMMGRDSASLTSEENFHRDVLSQLMLDADRLGSIECEGWRVRKDGTRFFGAGVLAKIGEGEKREYGRLIHDVTEIRRSEDEMRQAHRLEGIGVLAGGIAHDFNNLLTGIMSGINCIKISMPKDDPSYPIVEIAEQSSARAAELVAQLLAYAGKGQFFITRFDLSGLISGMLPLIASSIPKAARLELFVTPALPWIEADASQIRQVVMNLIINGAEAIGEEGGTVRISTGISDSGTDIFMEVKDSGSGMTEATKAKMFDPFFTTKFTGRGLGLAAVSGIVRAHKGKMRVSSTPGQGTTFTVSFPSVPAEVPALVDPPPLSIPHGAGTILVVDDEAVLRKMAAVILEKSGYSVLVAGNGREAVEIFRQNAPQIAAILLDMTMPVMGGHEAFRLIREISPGVPVIISSGYTEVSTREELGRDAIAGFIQKPYIAAKLIATIQTAMTRASRPATTARVRAAQVE